MSTDKPSEKPSGWNEKWLSLVIAAIAPALSLLSLLSHEEVVVGVCLLFALLALIVIVVSWYYPLFTKSSTIVGADHVPLEVPLFKGWIPKILYLIIAFGLMLPIGWYHVRHIILPMAIITKFERSNIRYINAGKGRSIKVAPHEFFLTGDEEEGTMATGCAVMIVSRNGIHRSKVIHIESVAFEVESVSFVNERRRVGVSLPNIIMANRCSVSLSPDSSHARAEMLNEKGDPEERIIKLNDAQSLAEIHIQVYGKAGLYRIRPILTVTDETGRSRENVSCSDFVYVSVLTDNDKD